MKNFIKYRSQLVLTYLCIMKQTKELMLQVPPSRTLQYVGDISKNRLAFVRFCNAPSLREFIS